MEQRREEESTEARNNRLEDQRLRNQINRENQTVERRHARLEYHETYNEQRRLQNMEQQTITEDVEEENNIELERVTNEIEESISSMSPEELFRKIGCNDKKKLNAFFKDIDVSPSKACLLLYLNSGLGRFDQYKEFDGNMNNRSIDVDGICKEVKEEILKDKEMYHLIKSFDNLHSYTDGNLYACGLCGLREIEVPDRISFQLKDLNTIEWAHYSEEETNNLNEMISEGTVRIPISSEESCEICPCKAKSYYLSQIFPGRYYHVHPELVESAGNHEYTRVCPTCKKYPTKNEEKPPLSIANGIDFGSYHRIKEMVEPNLHEQLILSQIRLFQTIVRVSPNRGQRNYSRHNIKANAIMFIHDGPESACEEIHDNSFDNYMKLFFVDEEGHADRLAKKFSNHLQYWQENLS